ncbi:hypothetical protein GQ43DRAFT_478053 [Delitschia confertaspora ATCC 74209]|uniref:Vacuolar protein sorting-associated protein 8 central domain-containing protein n=1 Tax=Delitschia confertaspora ATCC 74209 TaxID=1513339 RepID=A0A9P4JW93_9PLEO|nr:hypothetical protein GQ43DRAFT_478053 [Delitschia confertaspora ATCC 74209]
MSSVSGESSGSGDHDNNGPIDTEDNVSDSPLDAQGSEKAGILTKDMLEEEREQARKELSNGINGTSFAKRTTVQTESAKEEVLSDLPVWQLEQATDSAEWASIPDDTPSIQGSALSSPGSSIPASHSSFRGVHRPSLQPFERRFSSRLSPSPLGSPRPIASPGFLSPRSRQSSLSSNILQSQEEPDTPQPPWEVVRWTKLKKITGQVFSEAGKRNFGRPTCLNVAASLVIGTSKGFILVFDYQQVLKSIIGPGTKAVECGPVTALAISADHTTVAGGHATGYIFTWELSRPAKPFLQIPPLDRAQIDDRRTDGHVSGVSVLHIGFLGTRHTALVSADDGGMAFSHLATRGLGAVGRTVKTTRILGRYPVSPRSMEKVRKPSSVLAFSPLPLGNIEQATDDLGLTALLTPYLLVIVSTTPVAQTQHKAPRPKEIAPHSALSGCLAWFPAVKLKNPSDDLQKSISKTKLVYCWSNILTILNVDYVTEAGKEKPVELDFKPRSRWRSEEAIVAVQWLSRSVLGVLTISQRLIILEDNSQSSLRMTDTFDLLHKHIYHSDLFSKQLRPVVEQLNEEDPTMHGVVADAFYVSFRAYKGRLFLLGSNDISIGTLSNWADRLLALMEDGDFIAAIDLATSYYNGDTHKLTVGLPDDDRARHALVQEKLLEMISASLKYAFARTDDGSDKHKLLTDLATVCFTGCMSMNELDFLYEDVYEAFEEGSAERIFFETLEPYILSGKVSSVPPNVLKDLISFYASSRRGNKLEEMICRLNTDTMDINQITTLCKQYNLYEALIYIWTRAIGDFITPLIDILTLIKLVGFSDTQDETENIYLMSAMKIFPYLSYTFTGRVYPSGTFLENSEAREAKKDLYRFLFSGRNLEWPPGSGRIFLTRETGEEEPPFPYLRLLLEFDAGSFMSMLNEAFEDSFLNGEDVAINDHQLNGSQRASSFTPTRQYIINTLLGIMTTDNFDPEDIIYFYMFAARNLPKYPQHIILPGTSLHQILSRLCYYPNDTVKDDCQLSVEYLLSVYHPPDIQNLIPLFENAGFYRVLKSVYRGSQQYARLLEVYFKDTENRDGIFDCIRDCLKSNRGLTKKQANEIKAVIVNRARDLATIDASRAARILRLYAPDLLKPVLDALEPEMEVQYQFLRSLVEPEDQQTGGTKFSGDNLPSGFSERYVQLMCRFNSSHVADFVSVVKSGDLRLDPVLPALEKSGAIDAAVVLMARDCLVKPAMERLVKHLETLETALTGLIRAAADTPDIANTEEAVQDLLNDIQKYCKVGIWLCQGQTRSMDHSSRSQVDRRKSALLNISEEDLALDELLWLNLIDTVVSLTKHVTSAATDLDSSISSFDTTQPKPIDMSKVSTALRESVQQTFSALLASTTTTPKSPRYRSPSTSSTSPAADSQSLHLTPHQSNPSFLLILRLFLTRCARSSPSLSDLRTVLSSIFAAYAFEETILSLANRFLNKDAFGHVERMKEVRGRGWRPRGQVCEGCGKRGWGPGVGGGVFDAWVKAEERKEVERRRRQGGEEEMERLERGKGTVREADGEGEGSGKGSNSALVVFACRHLWHRGCLERGLGGGQAEDREGVGSSADTDTGGSAGDDRSREAQRHGGRYKCLICA